ncbi:hypothetical protein Pcinc_005558 [Petrolisthes cinctipes]|uniref:Uncharacterized protein n=1 Tax=Petrolisthes cinctipes TaxID=88211 RepID=A0AAE1GJ34_PETCI|nr:hypothetical protein Pcinc_005558 [Petrolisthes cinctipes]
MRSVAADIAPAHTYPLGGRKVLHVVPIQVCPCLHSVRESIVDGIELWSGGCSRGGPNWRMARFSGSDTKCGEWRGGERDVEVESGVVELRSLESGLAATRGLESGVVGLRNL